MNKQFHEHLPRLERWQYQTTAMVHWTMTIQDRATGWLQNNFHQCFRELMLHAAGREGLFCPAYCLMPDHLHLLWMSAIQGSDQRNGMKFLREHLNRLLAPLQLQKQPCDHVLRERERHRNSLEDVCFYILNNPVRAGLTERPENYLFSGSVVLGYPAISPFLAEFWPKFWSIYYSCYRLNGANGESSQATD